MSRVRDLFFDDFYTELERVAAGIEKGGSEAGQAPVLREEAKRRWRPYRPRGEDRGEALVSVDGGVQVSNFAYGNFVAVGRACALVHQPGRETAIEKRVRVYVGRVYSDQDRSYIPSYVRMIAEYEAARAGAERALEGGKAPVVLIDGSLYISRFPYAIHEYQHHPELLADLFNSMTSLHTLCRERGIPLTGVAKESAVFYLYMELLREAAARAGLGRYLAHIEKASSPLDLRTKMARWPEEDRKALMPLIEERPLCDAALIRESVDEEGYTLPLLLAPSLYYGREDAPALYRRIRRTLEPERSEPVVSALKAFFSCPGVALVYWKPTLDAAPFRVDISPAIFGLTEPWERRRNVFVDESTDLSVLEGVLNHLGFWYCNDVEYNLPLRQADLLARFDRALYRSKYEPFIKSRLERAGVEVRAGRRILREAGD